MTGAAFEIVAVVVFHPFNEHCAPRTRLGTGGFHIFAHYLFIRTLSFTFRFLKLCARGTKVLLSVTMRACLFQTGRTRVDLLEIAGRVHSIAVGCWTISVESRIGADVVRERCIKQRLDQ
jgi:hypothetical protein